MKHLVLIFTIWLALPITSCNQIDSKAYLIKRGDFNSIITESGDLQAVNARVLTMPYIGWRYGWNFKLTNLLDHGKSVSVGDTIAQFDGSTVINWLFERKNRLEVEKVIMNKLLVEQQVKLATLESQIESAKASTDLKKLQVEKMRFESERKRMIKQKELEKAETELRKAIDRFNSSKTVLENELKIQQIKIDQLENDIADAEQALSKLTVRSPINGMVQILENRRSRNNFQMGDEVNQGQAFVSVPDMSIMKVKSIINEEDYYKIFLGQKAVIRLDAFPAKQFHGKIQDIGKLSYKKSEKSNVKVFDIVIQVEDSDPILKPGMTVSCDIYIAEMQNVFFVENECVFKDLAESFIFVDDNGKQVKHKVNLGPSNTKFTVIDGDVKEGWKVVPRNKLTNTAI